MRRLPTKKRKRIPKSKAEVRDDSLQKKKKKSSPSSKSKRTYKKRKSKAEVEVEENLQKKRIPKPKSKVETNRKPIDRKSTRLNSSHRCISYAVFCLKK